MEKKLYRSKNDKKICGVCGGLAKYFNFDPTIARLACALLEIFTTFIGLLTYIVAALVIPEEPVCVEGE